MNDGLTKIEERAFEKTGLQSIHLPKSVKTIGGSAFSDCVSLTSVALNNGLEEIGLLAFSGSPVKCFEVPSTVKTIGSGAFASKAEAAQLFISPWNSEAFPVQPGWLGNTANWDIYIKGNGKIGTSFMGYMKISTLDCDKNLTIPMNALSDSSLQRVRANGALTAMAKACAGCRFLKSVSCSGGGSLGRDSFRGCNNLSHVSLYGEVKIGAGAFLECPKLRNVTLPKTLDGKVDGVFDSGVKITYV